MSEMSNEAIQAQIRAKSMRIGNVISTTDGSTDAVAFTAVTQLTSDAEGKLQGTPYLPVVIPTSTQEAFQVTGSPNGNILTQTFVAGASVTTATAAGWIRVYLTSDNSAIMSTGYYYIPFVTLA